MKIIVISPASYDGAVFDLKCKFLIDSSKLNNTHVQFYDIGSKFINFFTSKVLQLSNVLENISEEVVCIMDSSDTIINNNIEDYYTIVDEYLKEYDIIISSEKSCYPIKTFIEFYDAKKYNFYKNFKYLNSGFIIGKRVVILECLNRIKLLREKKQFPYMHSDQFWWTYLYLFDDFKIVLDTKLLCLNMLDVKISELATSNGKIQYDNIIPFVIHFNGYSKSNIDEVYNIISGKLIKNENLIKINKSGCINYSRFGKFDNWILNHVYSFYKDFPECETVLDIGGHAGYFSIMYKNKYKNSNVFMFEPYEDNFKLALKNISNNNLNINCRLAAICGNEVYNYVNIIENHNLGRILVSNKKSDIKLQECININEILDGMNDNIGIKIDVEGAEWFILKDISDNNYKKIKYISGEWNHDLNYYGIKNEGENKFKSILSENYIVTIQGNYFNAKRK